MDEYQYIVIETYPEHKPVIRMFHKITNLKTIVKYENAPAFNINSFNYVGMDGIEYEMEEIIGEIIEKVKLKK